MIKLNFVPQSLRKNRGNFWMSGFGPLSREVILGSLVAAGFVLIVLHLVLAGITVAKFTQQAVLQVRWASLGPEKKVFDDISKEIKTFQTKMGTVKAITSVQGVLWAKLLNDISDCVPKGVWIREINFKMGVLLINGSAVSKVKEEMMIINNFVALLKDKPSVKDNFLGIDVDSIAHRDNSALSVADFSLKIKRKAAQ